MKLRFGLFHPSLIVRLRCIFVLLMLLMLGLLYYQFQAAGQVLRGELKQQEVALSRALTVWLMDEARYQNALSGNVRFYLPLLAKRLEESSALGIHALLSEIEVSTGHHGVVLESLGRQVWTSEGMMKSVRWPTWLTDLPVRQVQVRYVEMSADSLALRRLFGESGLYTLIKLPLYFDNGDRAGQLILARRLVALNVSTPYLSSIVQGEPVVFRKRREDDGQTHMGTYALIRHIMSDQSISILADAPAFIIGGDQLVFDWHHNVQAYRQMLENTLWAIVMPFVIFFAALVGVVIFLMRSILRPLRYLVSAFQKIRAGHRQIPEPTGSYAEEIAYVLDETRQLLRTLWEREDHLAQINNRLESKVAERTAQLQQMNERLRQLAFVDPLTGLGNRPQLEDMWQQRYAQGHHRGVVLALINIDFFRDINETHGGEVGNHVLRRVGEQLESLWADTEAPVSVFRLGADEFCVLVEAQNADARAFVAQRLNQLYRAFSESPMRDLGMDAPILLSIGWTHVPSGVPMALQAVLHQADSAMRAAKGDMQHKVQAYDPQRHHDRALVTPQDMYDMMRMVNHGDGLRLFCQPIVAMSETAVGYAEVLARFERDGQMIPPGRFLPMIERMSLQAMFDRQVLSQLERQLSQGIQVPGLSVNLTPETLAHESLFDWLRPLAPFTEHCKIVLEITETTLIKDLKSVEGILKQFREMGFKVAIDDFGSGYSSISYLAHLSADIIKFDRNLAVAAFEDPRSARIILGLAEELAVLGYEVVFEGVENAQMAEFFQRPYIHYVQGYHYGRPDPCDQLSVSR